MAQASPALALADTTAQAFSFTRRSSVNVQVRFYEDTAGTVPIAAGDGVRDLEATNSSPVYERGSTYRDQALISELDGGALSNCTGGTWYELLLGNGMQQISISASGGSDPVGPPLALSYRIILDVEGDV